MYEVIYYSMGGNTKKLAEAIAGELGVEPEDVKTKASLAKDSLIFLGSGIYNQKPGKALADFIERNDFTGRKVAVFGTASMLLKRQLAGLEKMLAVKGAIVTGSFGCRGEAFFFNVHFNRNRPNTEDLEAAREFAQKMKAT
jgi:flavodoxin I